MAALSLMRKSRGMLREGDLNVARLDVVEERLRDSGCRYAWTRRQDFGIRANGAHNLLEGMYRSRKLIRTRGIRSFTIVPHGEENTVVPAWTIGLG